MDRIARDEVPVHGVTEYLVDAHAVLVDGKPLRRSDCRRGEKAAKLHILLERIYRGVVIEDARYTLKQAVGHAVRFGVIKVLRRQCLGVGGHLVAVNGSNIDRSTCARGCRQRSGADDIDRGQLYGSLRGSAMQSERGYRHNHDADHRKRSYDLRHVPPRISVVVSSLKKSWWMRLGNDFQFCTGCFGNRGTHYFVARSWTAVRTSSGRFFASSFCRSCQHVLTTVL